MSATPDSLESPWNDDASASPDSSATSAASSSTTASKLPSLPPAVTQTLPASQKSMSGVVVLDWSSMSAAVRLGGLGVAVPKLVPLAKAHGHAGDIRVLVLFDTQDEDIDAKIWSDMSTDSIDTMRVSVRYRSAPRSASHSEEQLSTVAALEDDSLDHVETAHEQPLPAVETSEVRTETCNIPCLRDVDLASLLAQTRVEDSASDGGLVLLASSRVQMFEQPMAHWLTVGRRVLGAQANDIVQLLQPTLRPLPDDDHKRTHCKQSSSVSWPRPDDRSYVGPVDRQQQPHGIGAIWNIDGTIHSSGRFEHGNLVESHQATNEATISSLKSDIAAREARLQRMMASMELWQKCAAMQSHQPDDREMADRSQVKSIPPTLPSQPLPRAEPASILPILCSAPLREQRK